MFYVIYKVKGRIIMKSDKGNPIRLVVLLILSEFVMTVISTAVALFASILFIVPVIMLILNFLLYFYILPRYYTDIISERIILIFYIVLSIISFVVTVYSVIEWNYSESFGFLVLFANRVTYPLIYDIVDRFDSNIFAAVVAPIPTFIVNLANCFIFRYKRKRNLSNKESRD